MIIYLEEICLQLFLWLLQLIDGTVDLFNALCGIDDVRYAGENVNIIESTLTNQTVESVFWCIIIVAVGLACIFTIVAVIKNMITSDKALSSIIGKFFLAILGTIAMLVVVILGILIANGLLRILADIFSLNTDSLKLSSILMNACTGEWINGFTIKDFNVWTTTVRDLVGDYEAVLWIFPTSWSLNGMLDPSLFYYAPALIAVIMLAWNLLKALLSMARRLFEIVYCYFCMPVAMSTLPLDSGARFRNWTVAFLSKILLAFGCVLSVNIFTLLLPVYTSLSVQGAGSFENAVFMIILVVGGAMVIPAGQALFVRIFASGDERMDLEGRYAGTAGRRAWQFGTNALIGTTGGLMFTYKAIGKKVHSALARTEGGDGGDGGAYRDSGGTGTDGTGTDGTYPADGTYTDDITDDMEDGSGDPFEDIGGTGPGGDGAYTETYGEAGGSDGADAGGDAGGGGAS